MNAQQREKFKKMLEEKRSQLETELSAFARKDPSVRGDWESTYPMFDEGFKLEEVSGEVEELANRVPVEYALELRLKAITQALVRIAKGSYGTCANCGKPIPIKRLLAVPETNVCLTCRNNRRTNRHKK
jgi:DnaK suppressor protein